MTSPQYVERAGGQVIPAAPPAATATGGGDASEGCFDLSASKGGNSIKLSDGDATATIGARDSWAVTKQALSTSGAFSFVLLNDNKDDEGSCFGIVPERHLGSLPDRQHDSRAIDGGAYFRSYEGKVADCSGGGSTDHQFKLHVGGKVRIEVDLAKALLDPQAGGFSGGAFGDTLAGGDSEAAGLATRKAIETMEGVSERFAAEVGMSPLQARTQAQAQGPGPH